MDVPKDGDITATCCVCGRIYKTNELCRTLVQEGKIESLCGFCDGSHDDHDYPPEQESIDDDKRHPNISEDRDER